jgi:hypothetical protein
MKKVEPRHVLLVSEGLVALGLVFLLSLWAVKAIISQPSEPEPQEAKQPEPASIEPVILLEAPTTPQGWKEFMSGLHGRFQYPGPNPHHGPPVVFPPIPPQGPAPLPPRGPEELRLKTLERQQQSSYRANSNSG